MVYLYYHLSVAIEITLSGHDGFAAVLCRDSVGWHSRFSRPSEIQPMLYPTLRLAIISHFSRCAGSVKTVLQRAILATMGTATVVAFVGPAQAEVLTALSFELEAAQSQSGLPAADVFPNEHKDSSELGVIKSYAEQTMQLSRHSSSTTAGLSSNPPTATAQHSGEGSVPVGAIANTTDSSSADSSDPIPAPWWEQGSDSPIAVAIGNAEGTRQPDGAKNAAYYWHQDPGNGADNFGTFSYQHFSAERTRDVRAQVSVSGKREVAAAQSLPDLADQEQMQRLRGFYQQLQRQAREQGIVLTPLEILNGLDLINQSEAAGLSNGGYIDRLVAMRKLEEDMEEQIKEARSWAYWHPERKAWDAPGLGNGYQNVRRDQDRRFEAVKRAMEEYVPNGRTLVAQQPDSRVVPSRDEAPRALEVQEETLLATAARLTQADVLSFGLSHIVAAADRVADGF